MATVVLVQPGRWHRSGGLWIRVKADPLAGPNAYPVTIHHGDDGRVLVLVDRPNGGFQLQTYPPDFADFDGGLL